MAASMLSTRSFCGVSRSAVARRSSGSVIRGAVSNGSKVNMRAMWLPGSDAPAHLDGSMPADFGFDPINLGACPEQLKWYREAELQNARWAMLAVAGILGQEIINPKVLFYDAAIEADLPFPILGVVAVQFLTMHYVEIRRWRDFQKPGSMDVDPLFPNNKLKAHDVGYPGGIFDPLGFATPEMKVKELKNGRLAMLAFAGFVIQAQATGLNPLACLSAHLSAPVSNTLIERGVVTGSTVISPGCAIEPFHVFQGINIPTPCLPFWP